MLNVDDVNINMDAVNMTEAHKRGYHHGDLRAALGAVALTLLDESGIDALTIREVARRAGVAHSAPANHFKDRKALLTEIAAGITRDLVDILATALSGPADRRARLRAAMTAILDYALSHPHRYRLVNRHDILDLSNSALADAQQKIFDVISSAIELPRRAASGRETLVVAVWSLVHGYVSLRLDWTLVAGADEVTGAPRELALIDVLIDGMK
jgi:AcrR family transcriptional regulator